MMGLPDFFSALASHDSVSSVRRLINSRNFDITVRDSMQRTILHWLCQDYIHWSKLVHELVKDRGLDINSKDALGRTPLCSILENRVTQFLKEDCKLSIVPRGVSPEVKRIWQKTRSCSPEERAERLQAWAVEDIVKLGADVGVIFEEKTTSLHCAVQRGSLRGVKELISLGVDVNALLHANITPLYLAFCRGHMFVVQRLVELGADINHKKVTEGAIHRAITCGRMDILKVLLESGAYENICARNRTLLAQVIELPDREKPLGLPSTEKLVRYFVDLGANINAEYGQYFPLQLAIEQGRADMVKYLVSKGANLNASELQRPALAHAVRGVISEEDYRKVELLVRCGADPNVQFSYGTSLLYTAIRLGHLNVVKALVELGIEPDHEILYENVTPLSSLYTQILLKGRQSDIQIAKLLLKHGANVNHVVDEYIRPIHYAVSCRNAEMVRLLVELGAAANINIHKIQGSNLLTKSLMLMGPNNMDKVMDAIDVLVEAGADLNLAYNDRVTSLHEAVRLGDIEMVETLAELKANLNCDRNEGVTPVIAATKFDLTEGVTYLAKKGADLNAKCSKPITPLQDAVRRGNTEMVRCLINRGADLSINRYVEGALCQAMMGSQSYIFEHLIKSGADVNITTTHNVSLLHDAIEIGDKEMIKLLKAQREMRILTFDSISLLDLSVWLHSDTKFTEILLSHGLRVNDFQKMIVPPSLHAVQLGKRDILKLLLELGEAPWLDRLGSSPLHTACQEGHLDQARLLLISGSDVNRLDHSGTRPFDCLPLLGKVNHDVLVELAASTVPICKASSLDEVSTVGCKDMATVLHTPGIGDVSYIRSPSSSDISSRAQKLLEYLPEQGIVFRGGKIVGVGGTAEGTKVGLPNEMDFLLRLPLSKDQERNISFPAPGFAHLEYMQYADRKSHSKYSGILSKRESEDDDDLFVGPNSIILKGSNAFHQDFVEHGFPILASLERKGPDDKLKCEVRHNVNLRRDRAACTLLDMVWYEGKETIWEFRIPVDLVPCFHVDNWPEGAVTKTWLMDLAELRQRGYVLVPKPPHIYSDLARKFTEEDLDRMWKLSFPHLETEHMQRLEQRIKDVYLMAKCLRNPDVSRIMVTDNGSLPRPVDKYLSSYMLKMIFLKNVSHFRNVSLSLQEMVCMVYDDLEASLKKGFIPLFFMPTVSALAGVKVDIAKSAKVAGLMARFAHALRLRGVEEDREPECVYRTYEIGCQ